MSYKLFTAFMLPIFISCVSWYFTFIIIIIIGWFYWIVMSARQFHQIKFKQLLAFPDCFHSSVLFLLVLVPCVKRKNYCAFAFWSGIAGLLDPNLLDRRTAIVEQFTLDLGVYWKLVGTSFQSTKGWANSVILSSSFVSIFVGISRFVHHPHAIRSSWGRSAGSSRHSHSSFHSFLHGKYLQLALHCLSNTPMESYTRISHARSHTRLNHGPPRKADTPRGQFIEKNNEKR